LVNAKPRSNTLYSPPNRRKAIIEPPSDTKLCLPEALYKSLNEAAIANNRTIEEEIIDRLEESLGIDNKRVTSQ